MNSNKSVRLIFWLLLFLFVVLGVWWTFHLPYDEDALYRAIPTNALVISEHDNLSERWQQILGNNAVRRSLHLFDDGAFSVDRVVRDKSVKWVCDHFAFKKTLVAFVPALGSSACSGQGQAWIFSSWAGGNVQFLKRGLITREMPELKKQFLEDGLVIWTLGEEFIPDTDLSLSLAVYDGVLLGCLSKDSTAVRYLLYRMQGRVAKPIRCFDTVSGKLFKEKGMYDRTWISKWLLKDITEYNDLRFGFKNIDRTDFQGKVYIENLLPEGFIINSGGSPVPATCCDISRILKFRPELLTISNLKDLSFSADVPVVNLLLKGFKSHRDSFSSNAPVFVGLFGGDASGRIMGLRVPAIVVGVKAKDSATIIANIGTILDGINAETGWGLIPNRMGVGATAKIGISSTRGGVYNSIKPAIKMVDNWLLFSSDVNALDNIIAFKSDVTISTALWPIWMPNDVSSPGSSYIWSDLRPAGKCARNALAVWSLSLSVNGGENKVAKKRMIYQVRKAIASLQEFGNGTAWIRPLDGGIMVYFRIND